MLKQIRVLLIFLLTAMLLLLGCGAPASANTPARADDIVAIAFDYQKQAGYASNQFAVWIEDADGVLVKTLFVTRFTANGGSEKRPDAIPVWVKQSGLAQGAEQDAVSGATPKSGSLRYVWDLTDQNGERVKDGTYTYYVEGTLRWKNHVLFSGEITLNGEAITSTATGTYSYVASDDQAALSDDAPEHNMIQNVTASYIPPSQQ